MAIFLHNLAQDLLEQEGYLPGVYSADHSVNYEKELWSGEDVAADQELCAAA
jgi:hypothetical protein